MVGTQECTSIGHLVSPGNKVTVTGMWQTGSGVYPKDHMLCSDAHPASNLPSATYLLGHLRQVT